MFFDSSGQFPSPAMWVVIIVALIAMVIYGEHLIQIVQRMVFNTLKIGMFIAVVVAVWMLVRQASREEPVQDAPKPAVQSPSVAPMYGPPELIHLPTSGYQHSIQGKSP